MYLDQSSNQLVKTHYLGRDGFVWWLGQIAPLTTSKSNTQDLSARKKDANLYYNRVKVRIFGYHTKNGSELPDVDLPWAHILVPPGVANGSLGEGVSVYLFAFFQPPHQRHRTNLNDRIFSFLIIMQVFC